MGMGATRRMVSWATAQPLVDPHATVWRGVLVAARGMPLSGVTAIAAGTEHTLALQGYGPALLLWNIVDRLASHAINAADKSWRSADQLTRAHADG